MTYAKPKQYCKYWKACCNFKRSECDDEVRDTKYCCHYREREEKEKKW